MRWFIPALAALVAAGANAQESKEAPPPPAVSAADAETPVDPDITIREGEDRTTYEYSANGIVYMIKIVPRRGRPYYLLDTDGDGVIDTETFDPTNFAVQMWKLWQW
ncbi:MAG: DUF2782 domain-containing protein [Pseudomonadota bacterium]